MLSSLPAALSLGFGSVLGLGLPIVFVAKARRAASWPCSLSHALTVSMLAAIYEGGRGFGRRRGSKQASKQARCGGWSSRRAALLLYYFTTAQTTAMLVLLSLLSCCCWATPATRTWGIAPAMLPARR